LQIYLWSCIIAIFSELKISWHSQDESFINKNNPSQVRTGIGRLYSGIACYVSAHHLLVSRLANQRSKYRHSKLQFFFWKVCVCVCVCVCVFVCVCVWNMSHSVGRTWITYFGNKLLRKISGLREERHHFEGSGVHWEC
jgi:hypothetical protein